MGESKEYLTHQLLRISQQIYWQLHMLHSQEDDETIKEEGSESNRNTENSRYTNRRKTFMETVSQYINGIETKFGWFLFEAVVNMSGDDHI